MRGEIVSCQLSVVSCRRVASLLGSAYRFQIIVQFWTEFVEHGLKLVHICHREQSAPIRSPKKMFRFVERSTGGSNKPSIVGITVTALHFSNICSNAIRGSHQLHSDSTFRERIPTRYQL